MKIVVLSDSHGEDIQELVPECDVLLLCGDISPNKMAHDVASQRGWFLKRFIPRLQNLKAKAKFVAFCGGNHDSFLFDCCKKRAKWPETENHEIHNLLPENVYYLCNNSVVINGLKIYGNPWCNAPKWAAIGPPVWNFATFNKDFLKNLYAEIPNDVDIIITHGPAYGFCDQILDQKLLDFAALEYEDNIKAENLGCPELAKRVKEIADLPDSKLRYCLSAHIHSANHDFEQYKNVKFAGVSILNESYQLGDYKPLEIEIENH